MFSDNRPNRRDLLLWGLGAAAAGLMPIGCGKGKNKIKDSGNSNSDNGPGNGDTNVADLDLRPGELTKDFFEAGGSKESEEAVELGLEWLAKHQSADGSWSFSNYGMDKDRRCNCEPGRSGENKVAATAFGLLPFIAHGFTHKGTEDKNKYVKVVDDGINRFIKMQKEDGSFSGSTEENNMYTHGLATICLCEMLNMSSDYPLLEEPCKKAVRYIVNAQHEKGGWRYKPKEEGDLSVVSWQLMALKSAQKAGVVIPDSEKVLQDAWYFLDDCMYLKWNDKPGHSLKDGDLMTKLQYAEMDPDKKMKDRVVIDGGYAYRPNGMNMVANPLAPATMTAAGILCRQYVRTKVHLDGDDDMKLDSPRMTRGIHHIMDNMPSEDVKNMYYYYYATQVLYNIHDSNWKKWNSQMRDLLIRLQAKTGHKAGSWDPTGDQFAGSGGRIMITSMALLTLEVYYRYLSTSSRLNLGIMRGN